jgi:hypothetical protein
MWLERGARQWWHPYRGVSMRRTEILTAGGVTLAGLGALVGLAIGSGEGTPKTLTPRSQPVEVRTEIIRKTVNVYRREHPHHVAGTGAGGGGGRSAGSFVGAAGGAVATRTRSSGVRAAAPVASAAPVVSRSSGARPTSGSGSSGGSGSRPVSTRSSGGGSTGGGSGSSHRVVTRSSGGGGGDGGGHDD